jgi:hypothetical protein
MGIISDGLEIMKLVNMGASADVHERLGKFVDKAQELQAKVEALEETNKQLRDQLRFRGSLVRVNSTLFAEGDDEPLCSRCAEVDKKLVHIQIVGRMCACCPECETSYAGAQRRSEMGANAAATPVSF